MKRLLLALCALVALGSLATPAAAATPTGGVDRATGIATCNTLLPTNGQGQITAAGLRQCITLQWNSLLASVSNLADLATTGSAGQALISVGGGAPIWGALSSITGQATLAQLPSIGANTFLCNATGGSAAPTACGVGTGQFFNVLAYASPQAAVTAAIAAHGGTVYFPCGAYTSSSTLNANSSNSVRIMGANGGPNGGANTCVNLSYSGVGTAISATSSVGFELDHMWVTGVGGPATKVVDLTSSTNAYAHDNSIFGTGAGVIGILLDQTVNALIDHNEIAIPSGIDIQLATVAGHFAVKDSITHNILEPGAVAIKGGGDNVLVQGNTFEASTTNGYASGAAGTCSNISFISNWFGDDTTGVTWINSNCNQTVSIQNTYGHLSTGTSILISNSVGGAVSIGDTFTGTTAVNIGTGNTLSFISPNTTGITTVVGTPVASVVASQYYGPVSINTNGIAGSLAVATTTDGIVAKGITNVASDYATNGGVFALNKDSGLGGAAHLFAADNGSADPILINELGGVVTIHSGAHPAATVLNGTMSVSGAATLTAGIVGGVSCSGSPTASFASVNGVVTHC